MQASIMEGHARSEHRHSFSDILFSMEDLHLESNVLSLDENQNPNPSLDNDFLGFLIDENKSRNAAAEGIFFCGKLIDDTSKSSQNPDHENKTSGALARRNSDSQCKYSNAHSSSMRISATRSKSAPVLAGKKEDLGSNYKTERRSKLACSSKSRTTWMFGSGRYPRKMELSDLRSRQLRFKNGGEEEKSSGKRMPVLIRVLGCVGGFDDTMIKGSTGGTYVSSY